jgi:hypothetical protein
LWVIGVKHRITRFQSMVYNKNEKNTKAKNLCLENIPLNKWMKSHQLLSNHLEVSYPLPVWTIYFD